MDKEKQVIENVDLAFGGSLERSNTFILLIKSHCDTLRKVISKELTQGQSLCEDDLFSQW